jgi:GT2 family glycosyltransferase
MQRRGLDRSTAPVACHIVLGMGDREAATVATGEAGPLVTAVHVDAPGGRLPLAGARNAGAEAAIGAGAELLIFLDVDCIPAPGLVARYVQCAGEDPAPRLLCGPVAYLPPPPPDGYDLDAVAGSAEPHPGRPCPAADETLPDGDPRLFWSLSFAVRPDVWWQTGGFCEQYRGYGGEDTDFGQRAAAAGVRLDWTGGADAYHSSTRPPTRRSSTSTTSWSMRASSSSAGDGGRWRGD